MNWFVNCWVNFNLASGVLFNVHFLPLGDGINFHSYADDTHLDIAVSPEDIDDLCKCIFGIKSWAAGQFLPVNQDKMTVLATGPKALRERLDFKI